jgi:hypothetical protein
VHFINALFARCWQNLHSRLLVASLFTPNITHSTMSNTLNNSTSAYDRVGSLPDTIDIFRVDSPLEIFPQPTSPRRCPPESVGGLPGVPALISFSGPRPFSPRSVRVPPQAVRKTRPGLVLRTSLTAAGADPTEGLVEAPARERALETRLHTLPTGPSCWQRMPSDFEFTFLSRRLCETLGWIRPCRPCGFDGRQHLLVH